MNDGADAFLGVWELIPELCLYQRGEAPVWGRYKIEAAEGRAVIMVAWETASGAKLEMTFGGPMDGSRQTASAPGVTHASFKRVDERTLDSAAYSGETQVAYARRRASEDGELLATVQENRPPGGEGFRNFQVYRRARG